MSRPTAKRSPCIPGRHNSSPKAPRVPGPPVGLIVAGEENVEDLPEGAVTTEEQLQAVVSGRLAVGPIERNEIITDSQWAQLTVDLKPLSELIPSGKQAMTISTDAVRGVNGFVRPGDMINLIITLDIEFNQIPVDSPIFGIPTETTAAEGAAGRRGDRDRHLHPVRAPGPAGAGRRPGRPLRKKAKRPRS